MIKEPIIADPWTSKDIKAGSSWTSPSISNTLS
jgi:hypothetical protein